MAIFLLSYPAFREDQCTIRNYYEISWKNWNIYFPSDEKKIETILFHQIGSKCWVPYFIEWNSGRLYSKLDSSSNQGRLQFKARRWSPRPLFKAIIQQGDYFHLVYFWGRIKVFCRPAYIRGRQLFKKMRYIEFYILCSSLDIQSKNDQNLMKILRYMWYNIEKVQQMLNHSNA